jgi:AAA+ ATPase superfamily predicted ATPase
MRGLERGDCAVLKDRGSDGKTTVLGYVHQQLGGVLIGVRTFLAKLAAYEPAAIEEAFLALFDEHIAEHDLLIVDDLHLVKNVVESCDYIRKSLFGAVLTAALESAAAARKKVLLACDEVPDVVSRRGHSWFIEDFSVEDFTVICSAYLKPAFPETLRRQLRCIALAT